MTAKLPEPERKARHLVSSRRYYYAHREEIFEKRKIWLNKNRNKHNDRTRNSDLKRLYGITIDDYYRILDEQSGLCAICGVKDNNGKRFVIDHDHVTGDVRGLLCGNCNRAIGLMRDSINIIESAARYLKEGKHER